MIGLLLPSLTAADPDLLGEGGLDPLGLASLADRLADLIAPKVTDRMKRAHTRLITVMTACAVVTEPLEDISPADGRSSPYLVAEWHVVEALASDRSVTIERLPGINKARSAVNRGGHLDAGSYLVMPSVFGFHGIFKPLARDVGFLDANLRLTTFGAELVEAWEIEAGLQGYSGRQQRMLGGRFANHFADAIRDGLANGRVVTPKGANLWGELRRAFNPVGAGPRERDLVWRAITSPEQPYQREALQGLALMHDLPVGDLQLLARLAPGCSEGLLMRFEAINRFEVLAHLLLDAFDSVRYVSSSRGSRPLTGQDFSELDALQRASVELSSAFAEAERCLAKVGLDQPLADSFGEFSKTMSAVNLFETLMLRHFQVQAGKGKLPWFDDSGRGYAVRVAYALLQLPDRSERFIHPYRLEALRAFVDDLRHP